MFIEEINSLYLNPITEYFKVHRSMHNEIPKAEHPP